MRELTRRELLAASGIAALAPTLAGPPMTRRLEVNPPVALQDVPLRIRLSGLEPSAKAEIEARMTTRDGTAWLSHAVFAADAKGELDAATSSAIDGSYRGISPMGLIWSMEREGGQPSDRQRLAVRDPVVVTFTATIKDGTTLQDTALRNLAGNGVRPSSLDDSHRRLRGGWWLPAGRGRTPR